MDHLTRLVKEHKKRLIMICLDPDRKNGMKAMKKDPMNLLLRTQHS